MAARKQAAAKTPLAGSLAAPVRGGCYVVRPGGPDGPEHFSPTLAGMCEAISRAKWLSVGGPDQAVSARRSGHGPRVFWSFSHGVCTQRPACVIPAPAPAAV
jgi:hypothetical protein